jgi:hypothetical protein
MPAPLDYASPQSRQQPTLPTWAGTALCLVLTVVTVQTFVRIEVLNLEAGNPLPHPPSYSGKWRASPVVDETSFRYFNARFDPSLMSRPLSPAERDSIRRNVARNRLRGVVGSWGLLQYLLAPATVLLSATLMLQRRPPVSVGTRVVAAVCVSLNLLAGVSMIHRGYMSSLGI